MPFLFSSSPVQSRKRRFFNSFSLRNSFLARLSRHGRISDHVNYSPVPVTEDDSNDDSHFDLSRDKNQSVSSCVCCDTKSYISDELKYRIFAWICMLLAILSGSSIGPVFKYMETNGVHPFQAASWRSQCMIIWLIPFCILEAWSLPKDKVVSFFERKQDLPFPLGIHVIIAGLMWCGSLLLWIIAIQYTTTVRASIFWNIHPLLLVIYVYCTGGFVSGLEWLGVILAIIGVFVTAIDGLKELFHGNHDSSDARAFFGDCLCMISGICEVAVIMNRKKIKPYVPLMLYTLSTTIVLGIVATVLSIMFESSQVFCFAETCVFGWTSKKWLKFMLLFGFYIGLFCFSGFNYAMQYMSPIVFSSINMLDPPLTGILSWSAGLEKIPNIQTWIGGAIILLGIASVSIGEYRKNPSESSSHEGRESEHQDKGLSGAIELT